MTRKLFTALYVGLFVSMIVMIFGNFLMTWILFGFFFLAVFGGLMLVDRPRTIVLGFLIVSLIVLGTGLYSVQGTIRDWITIIVGASMTSLSSFTLIWILFNPPAQPSISDTVDKGYEKMNEQEFLHQVSIDSDVNIELLKDFYQNENLWSLIRAGSIINAIKLLRSIQPGVELNEAKMVVEAFAARKVE